jgi:uncharacterized membrane protein YciS (DUF1049 family)
MSQIYKTLSATPPPPGFVETLTGNTGGAVGPDGSDNINVVGDGTTITVAGNPGTNTLTISAINAGFTWNEKAVSFNAIVENGYFCTAALTATLPVSVGLSIGNTIIIYVDTASSVIIQANAGEFIQVGINISGSGGTATSNTQGSILVLVYRPADTTWHAISSFGSWNVV